MQPPRRGERRHARSNPHRETVQVVGATLRRAAVSAAIVMVFASCGGSSSTSLSPSRQLELSIGAPNRSRVPSALVVGPLVKGRYSTTRLATRLTLAIDDGWNLANETPGELALTRGPADEGRQHPALRGPGSRLASRPTLHQRPGDIRRLDQPITEGAVRLHRLRPRARPISRYRRSHNGAHRRASSQRNRVHSGAATKLTFGYVLRGTRPVFRATEWSPSRRRGTACWVHGARSRGARSRRPDLGRGGST